MNESFNNVYDLDSDMDLKLLAMEFENIPSNHIKKRIKREFKDFKQNCSLISVNYNDYKYNHHYKVYDKPLLNITVMDKLYKNNNVYSFIINENYPFKPPIIEINFVNYSVFLKTSQLSSMILRKMHNINCLCCNTITCHSNWSPSHTINHIILEIRKYKRYKKHIIYKIFADKIKNKYLIDDIDLDSWLW